MDDWVLKIGYPLVTITQQNDSNIFYITQNQFLLKNKTDNKQWYVPFTYITSKNDQMSISWLKPDSLSNFGIMCNFFKLFC